MKKSLLMIAALAFGLLANAQTQYFFSPEGNGDADGSSWENAAAGEYLGETIEYAEVGDVFYLMEGNYLPSTTTNKWNIKQGVIIKGGYPTTMTGTNTAIDYSKAGQSIFSADLDGDRKGDNIDYALVYIGPAGHENSGKVDGVAIEDGQYYKDVPLTEIWGVTFRDGARVGGEYFGNIMYLRHTKVDLHFCKFLNNVCGSADKTAALISWGSQLRAFDCVFENNWSAGAGSAVLLRPRKSLSGNDVKEENQLALFERCEFTNNQISGSYGGTLSVCDGGGTLYMINCTVTGGSQTYGGAIALGGNDEDINPCKAFLINNTFVDNASTRANNWTGGAYRAGKNSHSYFINNVMVNPAAKDSYNVGEAVVEMQWANTSYTSAGYNIFGTFFEKADDCGTLAATDKITTSVSNVQTQEKIFGTATLADNGGFSKSFLPLAAQATSLSVADLKAAVAAWPMEDAAKEVIDLTVDQRGAKRASTTMAGSIDGAAQVPTAIENTTATTIQDGIYYTLQGQALGKDFYALPSGMYICNGVKIVK